MRSIRDNIGGLGNLLFKEAFIYACMRSHQIPDIYLQDERYFAPYADEIKQRFGEGIKQIPGSCAIHVRRGDYVNNPFHSDLSETDYYVRAKAMVKDKTFHVFSDDVGWCKQQDVFKYCLFPQGKNEIEDFNLMAGCEVIIMANSTFSWWASYVNPNPNKRIIAPKETTWFKDGVVRCKLLDNWKQI